jgi:hypothetical protein
MKIKRTPLLLPACLSFAVVACAGPGTDGIDDESSVGVEDGPQFASSAQALRSLNGRALNGRALNGRALNGRAWNGRAWNGSSLGADTAPGVGWRVEGQQGQQVSLLYANANLSLSGSRLLFNGVSPSQRQLWLSVPASPGVRFRVDGPFPLPNGVDSYHVFVEDNGVLSPMFPDAAGQSIASIPLRGEWNTDPAALGTPQGGAWTNNDRITFAARGFALAKCVELGYRPWVATLARPHRACVRMLRADYCGDGNSWTLDGTLINIYDVSGVQARDSQPPVPGDPLWKWDFEAEWTENGAVCVDDLRIKRWLRENGGSQGTPRCFGSGVDPFNVGRNCGRNRPGSFGVLGTALIMTDYAKWDGP